jgi:Asp-tRNA(Asn)/Glu-tRNA(Gln) amidotransferase A subunit family amidase
VTQDFAGPPEPDSAAALEAAAKAAETAGASVRRLDLPAVLGEAWTIHPPLQDYEAKQALAWEYAAHRDLVAPQLRKLLDEAQALEPARYDEARRTARRARRALAEIFGEVDVLLTFSAPGPAPETLKATGNARFNRLWTLMGVPCVSVPGYETAAGLPVGVQIIAPFGRDALALAAAHFLERALAGEAARGRLIPRPAAAYSRSGAAG